MAPRSRRVLPLRRQRTPSCAGMVAKNRSRSARMETDGGGRTRADNHGRGQAEVSPIRWAQLAKLLLANVRLCPLLLLVGDVGSGVGPMDTMTIERLTGKQI